MADKLTKGLENFEFVFDIDCSSDAKGARLQARCDTTITGLRWTLTGDLAKCIASAIRAYEAAKGVGSAEDEIRFTDGTVYGLSREQSRRALAAALRGTDMGWLIELSGARPMWWTLGDNEEPGWTSDSLSALRFARKEDADACILDAGWTEAFASKHAWDYPPALVAAPQPSQSRDEVVVGGVAWAKVRVDTEPENGWCFATPPNHPDDIRRGILPEWNESGQFFACIDAGRAVLSASPQREGWVLVPVEPTEAMKAAVARLDWTSDKDVTWADGYRAMLAASPTPPPKKEG